MDKKYVVYQHTNKINGKKYIGITCQKPQHRYGKDGHGYKACPYFYAAIQKYGWQNFEHEILYDGLNYKEACDKQIELIYLFDLTDHNKGYNISHGGDSIDPEISGSLWNNESFKEFAKRRMKQAWKDPQKRKRRSQDTKKRWKDQNVRDSIIHSLQIACGRMIQCIETRQVFKTIKQASRKYNICSANITRSAKLGYKCGGYHWRYVDVPETLTTIETAS